MTIKTIDAYNSINHKREPRTSLIHHLQQHQSRLKEVLEEIEHRSISIEEVKNHLDWLAENLKNLRKKTSTNFL